jgi:DNA-binding GntR family transcriptional regulator
LAKNYKSINVVSMENELLGRIQLETLGKRVFQKIRDAIFDGRLKPGQILREMELARELAVSQATIREALGELEYLGLVSRRGRKGVEITNLSRSELKERIEVRVVLETYAFHLACSAETGTPKVFPRDSDRGPADWRAIFRRRGTG